MFTCVSSSSTGVNCNIKLSITSSYSSWKMYTVDITVEALAKDDSVERFVELYGNLHEILLALHIKADYFGHIGLSLRPGLVILSWLDIGWCIVGWFGYWSIGLLLRNRSRSRFICRFGPVRGFRRSRSWLVSGLGRSISRLRLVLRLLLWRWMRSLRFVVLRFWS